MSLLRLGELKKVVGDLVQIMGGNNKKMGFYIDNVKAHYLL